MWALGFFFGRWENRRILVIGNYVLQQLLRPLHEWLCHALRRLPCDVRSDQASRQASWI